MVASEWEKVYSSGRHLNLWPWSDLVSLYFRHLNLLSLKDTSPKVFELGSGVGNNYPFWRSIGAEYFGIELSASAVEICLELYPELQDRLQRGDFKSYESTSEDFDVICDRASVTHCNETEVRDAIFRSLGSLKKGGLYLGIDWFSKNHTDFNLPAIQIDSNTRSNFMTGQFMGLGQVHFADRAEMLDIFKDFQIIELTEKIVTRRFPDENVNQFASWNIVARKPL